MMVSANTARFGVLVKFPGRGVSSKLFVLELQPKFRLYLNAEKFEKLSTRKCLQWLPSLTSTTESLFAFPLSPNRILIFEQGNSKLENLLNMPFANLFLV
ncbi:uncharacterized protein [Malus domestica]|uniref:uncharacterized protein isoform X6 n=1 Tax=Malus domestica TaxID=3750 RepID=UPI0039765281